MEATISKDIYDKNGHLLIAKGVVVNERKIEVLRKLGVLDEIMASGELSEFKTDPIPEITGASDAEGNKKISTIMHDFVEKNRGFNDISLSRSAEEINNILHNHKEKPWYLHLKTLSNYIDWLYTHSINTALIAGMVGVRAGYNDAQLHELILGALFHDIGMILVPKNILLKSEPLTPQEVEIMGKHCELGYAMVSETDIFESSKEIILGHHENLDGTGYPNGADGSQMNEFTQIVAAVNYFDSMTSYRPYKETQAMRAVVNEMMLSDKYNHKFVKLLSGFIVD